MNKKKLVSIVIPAYNTPIMLFKKCIFSIISQSYSNIEIIVVDDGSMPEFAKQIDQMAECESVMKVIHKTNGGEGSARNTGIENARGEYVIFVDADDGLSYEWIQYAVSLADKYDSDVVSGKVIRVKDIPEIEIYDDKTVIHKVFQKSSFWELQRDFFYFDSKLLNGLDILDPGVCSKLIKRKCLQNIRFPIGIKLSSDQVVNHMLLRQVESYILTNRISYYYVENDLSISHVYQPLAVDYMMQSMELINDLIDRNPSVLQAFCYRVLAEITEGIQYAYFSEKKKLTFREKIAGVKYASEKDLVKKCFRIMKNKSLPNKQWKLKAFLLKNKMYSLFVIIKTISDIF